MYLRYSSSVVAPIVCSSPRPSDGLEDVGRVDRALGGARPDERVQLVDEEHAVARRLDLLDDLLQPLLELAAVLGARDERADVEREQPLAEERLGDVAVDDPLGEALDDGGLADARLADQGGVVLGAAATGSGRRARSPCARPMIGSSLPLRAAAVRSMPIWSMVGVRVAWRDSCCV